MNLSDTCAAIRAKTGYPERGETGTARLHVAVNYALRHLYGDMPEALLAETMRFYLEPVYTSDTYGQATKDTDDHRVFYISGDVFNGIDTKIMRARWIEIQSASGEWVQRRVQDVYYYGALLRTYIVLDAPWPDNTALTTSWRIWTAEYPYPADVQKVRRCVVDPDNSSRTITPSLYPDEMEAQRLGEGFRAIGEADFYGSGKFFQLPAPHYKPEVALSTVQTHVCVWGYDGADWHDTGAPDGFVYGPAGTFSYISCHVWGRRKFLHPTKGWGYNEPFYISAPSEPSDQITTTWGQEGIGVSTPNLAFLYGFGENEAYRSYEHCGLEKWIFRARHTVEPYVRNAAPTEHNHANDGAYYGTEADGIYYLWRIIEGNYADSTGNYTTWDIGDSDPPDRRYPLKDFHGHLSIAFDRTDPDEKQVLLSVVRRPPTLMYDTDVPPIPPECFEALVCLASAYLTGERDGDLNRKNAYYAEYLMEVGRFRRLYAQPGFARPGFGDGISPRRSGSARLLDGKITWSP